MFYRGLDSTTTVGSMQSYFGSSFKSEAYYFIVPYLS